MTGIWKRVSSIGLVLVLMATTLVSFPFVSAPPPDKCEPWPECRDGGEEPPADPAIAFYVQTAQARHPNRIVVMNADGSNQAVIYEEFFSLNGLSWSPDGSSLAWSGRLDTGPFLEYGIWRIDIQIVNGVPQGTNLRQLVSLNEGDGFFGYAAWSPLGDEIAYFVHLYDPHAYRIDAVPAAGGAPYGIYTAPEGHALDHGVTWSSDGTRLAIEGGEIAAGVEGKSMMIIERATGMVLQELLTGLDIALFEWARQGSDVLAFHKDSMVYTVDIDTETVVPITEGCCASWSPDNSKIVYLQPGNRPDRRMISVCDLDTGEITQLTRGGARLDWRPI